MTGTPVAVEKIGFAHIGLPDLSVIWRNFGQLFASSYIAVALFIHL
jgi:hypothetical protein